METTITISKKTAIVARRALQTILEMSKGLEFVSGNDLLLLTDSIDEINHEMNETEHEDG